MILSSLLGSGIQLFCMILIVICKWHTLHGVAVTRMMLEDVWLHPVPTLAGVGPMKLLPEHCRAAG